MRGGQLNDSRFGERFRGQGQEWEATRALFTVWRSRLGFRERPGLPVAPPKPRAPGGRSPRGRAEPPGVTAPGQLPLFSGLRSG